MITGQATLVPHRISQRVMLIITALPVEVSKIPNLPAYGRLRLSKLYGIADSSLTYLSFSLTEEATHLKTKSWSPSPLKFANSFVKDISERIATEASTLFASSRTDFDPDTQHEIRWLNTSYPVQALLI